MFVKKRREGALSTACVAPASVASIACVALACVATICISRVASSLFFESDKKNNQEICSKLKTAQVEKRLRLLKPEKRAGSLRFLRDQKNGRWVLTFFPRKKDPLTTGRLGVAKGLSN